MCGLEVGMVLIGLGFFIFYNGTLVSRMLLKLNTIDLNPETLPDIAEGRGSNTDEIHAFSFC